MPPADRGGVARLLVLVVIMGGIGVTVVVLGGRHVDAVKMAASEADSGGMLVYALGLVLVLLAPVPRNLVATTTGLLFGFTIAAGIVLFASVTSALAAFALSRLLARELLARRLGPRLQRLDDFSTRRALSAVLAARVAPVVPFWGFNYAAGLTGMRFSDYALGTFVGIIPGTMVYVALGAFGRTLDARVVAAGGLGLIAAAACWRLWRRSRPHDRSGTSRPDSAR